MSKRPTELPNIEDATLRACLASRAEASGAGQRAVTSFPREPVRPPPERHPGDRLGGDRVLGDRHPGDRLPGDHLAGARLALDQQPAPMAYSGTLPPSHMAPADFARSPVTLGEWKSLAAQEFAVFGTVQQLLGRTDAELAIAAREFPQQISGTLARLETLEQRLVQRSCAVTTLIERLHLAATRVETDTGLDLPFNDRGRQRSHRGR
jgi:hypothetical protein